MNIDDFVYVNVRSIGDNFKGGAKVIMRDRSIGPAPAARVLATFSPGELAKFRVKNWDKAMQVIGTPFERAAHAIANRTELPAASDALQHRANQVVSEAHHHFH